MLDIAVYRERLEAERVRLTNDLHHLEVEIVESADPLDPARGGVGHHLADDGDVMAETEKFVALQRNAQQLLAQVNHALERVTSGSYGICESCGQPINPDRLDARPSATLCVNCQQRQEGAR